MQTHTKINLSVILFSTVVIIFILVTTEVVMRKLDLPSFDACKMSPDYGATDPELGFAPIPGSEVAGSILNELGLRGTALPTEKAPDHFRILFLGDSTCWGLGVKIEDTFAAITTRLIAEDNPDLKVEYLLGAFPGYSSYQSKIMLKKLFSMNPDLIVFFVGANNDHVRARYFKDSDIPLRFARQSASWHKIHLLRAIEGFTDTVCYKFLRHFKSRDARARVPIKEFHENMLEMVESTIKHEKQAIILIPPYSNHSLRRHHTIPKYQECLETVSRELNVPSIKLQNIFQSHDENIVYFTDFFHFREFGHKLTANEINRIVAKEIVVKRSGF
jgi:lysophospholipase L1-like esterase|tara:strand:+ start:224 stop:1216 length:993 start_codon:yes stop_codon:yes gene_type:complete